MRLHCLTHKAYYGFCPEQITAIFDFEKAFDTLEWPFIKKTSNISTLVTPLFLGLRFFILKLVAAFRTTAGHLIFSLLTRGVRQECPLSPYLFLLCAEIFGTAVTRDDEVKGIYDIYDKECKVCQYADSTTLILNGSQSSIERSFLLLDAFAQVSGLKVNYEKTEALWISTHKNRTDKLIIKSTIERPFQKTKGSVLVFNCRGENCCA